MARFSNATTVGFSRSDAENDSYACANWPSLNCCTPRWLSTTESMRARFMTQAGSVEGGLRWRSSSSNNDDNDDDDDGGDGLCDERTASARQREGRRMSAASHLSASKLTNIWYRIVPTTKARWCWRSSSCQTTRVASSTPTNNEPSVTLAPLLLRQMQFVPTATRRWSMSACFRVSHVCSNDSRLAGRPILRP